MYASPVHFQPCPASLPVDGPAERRPLADIEALAAKLGMTTS